MFPFADPDIYARRLAPLAEEDEMDQQYPFIVIDRPGFYGREGRVYSRHRTIGAARDAAARHRYADEQGERRDPVTVAHNDGNRYRAGDTFYGDMPPREV